MNWNNLLDGPQAKAPNERLVAFAQRFNLGSKFLDIGPGRHAPNQVHLESRGFDVVSVDNSTRALKNIQADICEIDFDTNSFDLVYDINTLCHVENPPMENICRWLKTGGYFFSIAPTDDTWQGIGEGKDFTRYATAEEIERLHDCFSGFRCSRQSYPHRGNQINSWIIEAMK